MKTPERFFNRGLEFTVFCVGCLLVVAANAKFVVRPPAIIPPFPGSWTMIVWCLLILVEYMFGIPLLLGFGSVVFRRFAASLFAVFAIYQIANILIGKSNCDCFGYSVPSLLVLTIDLLSMASLVFSSVASHANPKGSVSRLRIRVGVVAVLGALIAFAFPLSPKMLLPGVLENGGADKQTIDLETLIQQDHPPQFRELLSDPPDFDGRSGDILIVRANCDSCQDFVDKWQLESTTIKDKNNSILLVIGGGDGNAKKYFPKWQGVITSFKSEYDIMVRTPFVLSIRNGKIVFSSLD